MTIDEFQTTTEPRQIVEVGMDDGLVSVLIYTQSEGGGCARLTLAETARFKLALDGAMSQIAQMAQPLRFYVTAPLEEVGRLHAERGTVTKPLSDEGCEVDGCTNGHMTTWTVGKNAHVHRRCYGHSIGGADAVAALAKKHDLEDGIVAPPAGAPAP